MTRINARTWVRSLERLQLFWIDFILSCYSHTVINGSLVIVQFFSRAVTDSPFLKTGFGLYSGEQMGSADPPRRKLVITANISIHICPPNLPAETGKCYQPLQVFMPGFLPRYTTDEISAWENLCVVWVNMGTWIHSAYMVGYWVLGMGLFQGLLLEHLTLHQEFNLHLDREKDICNPTALWIHRDVKVPPWNQRESFWT